MKSLKIIKYSQIVFQSDCTIFHSHEQCMGVTVALCSHTWIGTLAILKGVCSTYITGVFICSFLITSKDKLYLICLLAIHISYFINVLKNIWKSILNLTDYFEI